MKRINNPSSSRHQKPTSYSIQKYEQGLEKSDPPSMMLRDRYSKSKQKVYPGLLSFLSSLILSPPCPEG